MSEEVSKGNGVDDQTEPVKVPRKKKKSPAKKAASKKATAKRKRSSSKKSARQLDEMYNVEVHPETGVMRLPELHYCRLVIAEQKIKIQEKDLQLAKAQVKDFQTQANLQLQGLQAKVKEISDLLNNAKAAYFGEVRAVEEETKLALKDWTIDDDRILRPIEKEPPVEVSEA